MPNLLAMSFEGELAPSFDLTCLAKGGELPDGWGLGYYPGGEPSAVVLKEPAPPPGSIRSHLARAWEHLESSLFVLHIRAATWGAITDANTQPFVRSWGKRDWMIGHAGSLASRLADDERGVFQPVGSTDTEQVFCLLLNKMAEKGWKSIADCDLEQVRTWLDVMDDDGGLTIAIADGRDLMVYADRDADGTVYIGQLLPPYGRVALVDDDLVLDLGARGTLSRKGVLVASTPLEAVAGDSNGDEEGTPPVAVDWKQLTPGHLIVIRQGAVVAEAVPPGPGPAAQVPSMLSPAVQSRIALSRPKKAEVRRFAVAHRTVYRYAQQVERSAHVFRLTPVTDRLQTVLEHSLHISVPGQTRDFEDVFGNRVRRLLTETPWTEMVIEAKALVELRDIDPLDYRPLKARSTIPLVWMPWQRQTLQPFLLPPELPESELNELSDYAMSFVARNDYDLLDTLIDINQTIFREYQYRQGSTTVFTTPYEAYVNRRGVCQDFANLYICLARLLGVPARYVCGYVHCGPSNPNQAQSEASHAWVQLYLPEVGWKGFDPTNGVLTQTEHVRVAVGRNYVDASPTSGTIYVGGGPETLEVAVRVEPA